MRYHYKLIEQIFVFVATELINCGKLSFQSRFGKDIPLEAKHEYEKKSREELCSLFIKQTFGEKFQDSSPRIASNGGHHEK